MIAETISVFVNSVFNNVTGSHGIILVIAPLLFSIQIYADFSAYAEIAIGSAKMLGFQLCDNFRTPYLSKSISEFWNRWHISLSRWFKDYLYKPLGGNRKSFIRTLVNIAIVFIISGLWNGSNWTSILWGPLHGIYRIIEVLLKKFSNVNNTYFESSSKVVTLLRVSSAFLLVSFSWIFFR